ncbi:MAG: discoidin domain-containing protein, partial [Candidatus Cloacimonetes bacterium]|nr:discoidin domain-containing protein [Candidatus Cloacimonadota bacterium]
MKKALIVLIFSLTTLILLSDVNLALNRTATASNTQSGYGTALGVDGNSSTYWSSGSGFNDGTSLWYRVDLGATALVNNIIIDFTDSSHSFSNAVIQSSPAGLVWTTIATISDVDDINVSVNSTARYFQIIGNDYPFNYGIQIKEFQIWGAKKPTITTNSITSILENSAVSGGNITSDGGATVTSRGVCWNTMGTPTIANSYTTNGTGAGSFVSNMTGLNSGTTYYVRAYAVNSAGISYGSTRSFRTKKLPNPSTLIFPADGAVDQPQNITVNWNYTQTTGGEVTGFKVYMDAVQIDTVP